MNIAHIALYDHEMGPYVGSVYKDRVDMLGEVAEVLKYRIQHNESYGISEKTIQDVSKHLCREEVEEAADLVSSETGYFTYFQEVEIVEATNSCEE